MEEMRVCMSECNLVWLGVIEMVNGEDIGQNDWLSEQKMHLWHHELSFLQLVLNRFFAQRDSSCFFLRLGGLKSVTWSQNWTHTFLFTCPKNKHYPFGDRVINTPTFIIFCFLDKIDLKTIYNSLKNPYSLFPAELTSPTFFSGFW